MPALSIGDQMSDAKSSRSSEPPYVPDAGDLIWTDFDPSLGHEQAGRRTALVVSSADFTKNTGLTVVCPITSRIRRFPTSVILPDGLGIRGEVLVSHVRSIDTQARPIRYTGGAIPIDTAQLVRAKLNAFITI